MEIEPVIGLEIHTELLTESKVFCGCSTKFGSPPNTQTCPVCLGMPGTLPVLNKRALELSLKTALALNCNIPEVMSFDRKNYYYPDLPKNYQISQKYHQLGVEGYINLVLPEYEKKIGISDIHLEEDAGKNTHPDEPGHQGESWVDLNRAGQPLLEIVSAPDMRSLEEMECYMNTMRSLLLYLEVSDCKMEAGKLRFEVNVSIREKGTEEFGTRVEIKNLNSMKIAMKAAAHEIKRQKEVLEDGGNIRQETRLWDDARGVTESMRSKEEAQDYRYFPEPDLEEVAVDKEWLEDIRKNLPELQDTKRQRFIEEYGIPSYDAGVLVVDKSVADYFEECTKLHNNPKAFSNWIMVEIWRELREKEMDIPDFPVTPKHLSEMVKLIDNKTISSKIAKTVFGEMIESGEMPDVIVKKKGLVQVSDEGELQKFVEQVINENPGPVEDFKSGKEQAITFLMGQMMKLTRGKANPQMVREMLIKQMKQ